MEAISLILKFCDFFEVNFLISSLFFSRVIISLLFRFDMPPRPLLGFFSVCFNKLVNDSDDIGNRILLPIMFLLSIS
jgi:hypothetical protein